MLKRWTKDYAYCGTCVFWDRDAGECRRYAPQENATPVKTKPDFWCGEWDEGKDNAFQV